MSVGVETKGSEASVMSGGPNTQTPAHGETHPDLKKNDPPATKTEEVKYELNGKSFSSAAEMSQYVADLEKKVLTAPTQQQTYIPPVSTKPQVELIDGRPIDEVIFENPTKVLNHLENKVQRKFDERVQQEENKKQFWAKFYQENPDLNGKQVLVEAFVTRNWNTWQNLPVSDFSKAVSKETRDALKKMGLDKAVEIPNNNAATLGASGESTGTQTTTETKITTFVDELNAKRLKRKIK